MPIVPTRQRKPPYSKSVFINCPFDLTYKPIFRAIVFSVVALGYTPRSALDSTDGAESRISKIAKLIEDCDWAIHDLSRVEVDPDNGIPRFNMPLELGLHLGARIFGKERQRRKRALILEAESHRYDISISDISGQDIETHSNEPETAIRRVRDWLSDHRPRGSNPLPGSDALFNDYRLFLAEVSSIIQTHRLNAFESLPHSDLLFAISDWLATRSAAGH